MPEATLVEAINLALARAMADDERVTLLGEDIGKDGGVFRATDGLLARFGPECVLDAPLAEVAGLPHGGGKSVIVGNSRMPTPDKERVMRAFACAIRDLIDYIPGPDMGTGERCMAWVKDEIGRAVGLPPVFGGIPLDEIGATGFGLVAAIEAALPYCGLSPEGARIAVEGFGAVGRHAARFLGEKGALLVAAADSSGTVRHEAGLDVTDLTRFKLAGGRLVDYPGGKQQPLDAIIDAACDIWIPAARPDVLHAGNVGRLQAKLVAQGANIPATAEAEAALHARGVLVLPDFIANAGGVICAAVEYHGGTESAAFVAIAEKIGRNTREMLEQASRTGSMPRVAAVEMAERRVRQAACYRRWR